MANFEKTFGSKETIVFLLQIAEALTAGKSAKIRIGNTKITIPKDVQLSVEFEEEGGVAELEIELKWDNKPKQKRPGIFELYQSDKGSWYFRLKAANGEIILSSEAYQTKQGAKNGMASVKANADKEQVEMRTSRAGQPYFVLKAKNHEVIGTSQMYKSRKACEKGVKAVVKNAGVAEVAESGITN